MANKKNPFKNPFPVVRPKLMALPTGNSGMAVSPEMIGSRYFVVAMVVAFALHLAVIAAWYAMPKTEVVEVPVYALNLKLGDIDVSAEAIQAASPEGGNKEDIEAALSKLVRDERRDAARAKSVTSIMEKAIGNTKAVEEQRVLKHMAPDAHKKEIVKQYVRPAALKGTSSATGAGNKEIVARYEQLISLWIQKFKLYPDAARAEGKEGETLVRLRIDRRGNIRQYLLERSTGHPELDQAAIDMIRRSNPVPAVPSDYPEGDEFEFLIPVNFRLQ